MEEDTANKSLDLVTQVWLYFEFTVDIVSVQFEERVQSKNLVHDNDEKLLWIWKNQTLLLSKNTKQKVFFTHCRATPTFLISGEGMTVAVFLQLLPEPHDVPTFYKALAAKKRQTNP